MSKSFAKSSGRSRRKSARNFEGDVVSISTSGDRRAIQLSLPIAEILEGVQGALEATAGEAGLLIMKTLVDCEVDRLAGPKGKHDDRPAVRWGDEESYIVFGGKKVPFLRPRVRARGGRELPLELFQRFQKPSALEHSVAGKVICGVATRRYEQAVDGLCDGYGVQRSSVSRHWKAVSATRLAEFVERRLEGLDLAAILIDGIDFQKKLLVVAMGVDTTGKKHVLGLRQGTTENSEVCSSLLSDLVDRGVPTDRRYLFVLDGSKALEKAVRRVFDDKAEIQRCQVHKLRNVLEHLPEASRGQVRMRLRAAWSLKDYEQARSELLRVVQQLRGINPSAARSLEEGLEETLTLHRLAVPDSLRVSLRSTNVIESCFSATRHLLRNVKRWRDGSMVERWVGTMLLEAQKKFRRVKGHRGMPRLLSALGRTIDQAKVSA